MNQATAYIDLSNVYSASEKEGPMLRDVDGGYMLSPTEPDGRYMLLRNKNANDGCNRPEMIQQNLFCFKSGKLVPNSWVPVDPLLFTTRLRR